MGPGECRQGHPAHCQCFVVSLASTHGSQSYPAPAPSSGCPLPPGSRIGHLKSSSQTAHFQMLASWHSPGSAAPWLRGKETYCLILLTRLTTQSGSALDHIVRPCCGASHQNPQPSFLLASWLELLRGLVILPLPLGGSKMSAQCPYGQHLLSGSASCPGAVPDTGSTSVVGFHGD
jgi:hypothetical protein